MADKHTSHVAALLRKRAHLNANADLAKRQEVDEQLRLAGIDVAELDEEPEAEREPEPVPGRHAPERQTADAPTAPKRGPGRPQKNITGSGGLTLPKSESKG